MSFEVSSRDLEVLRVLSEESGLLTGRVAKRVGVEASGARKNSALIRQRLLYLQRIGLVDELDPHKPTLWRRTSAGTKAIQTGRCECGLPAEDAT